MSTHCVVCSESNLNDGRYVHSDGYPEGVGYALCTLIARDGVDKVIQTVINDAGWSTIDADMSPEYIEYRKSYLNENRFRYVDGYGFEYTKIDLGDRDPRYAIDDEEYGYIIKNDGSVEAYYTGRGKMESLGEVFVEV